MPNELKGVELFAVGTWNGFKVDSGVLAKTAESYNSLKDIFKIPLKFGHNDGQPMTDGQPALGWVSSVRVDNGKLVADFTDVPDIVYNVVSEKLYNSLSIELEMGVSHKGKEYEYVLSGVALLGADLPAVNTLKDLNAYLPKEKQVAMMGRKVSFTTQQKSIKGATMPTVEELQAMLDSEKAKKEALQAQLAKAETERLSFQRTAAEKEAEAEQLKAAQAKALFTSRKTQLTQDYNTLVERGVITPAQRDAVFSKVVDGDMSTLDSVESTHAIFSLNSNKGGGGGNESGRTGAEDTSMEEPADKVLLSKVRELRASTDGAKLNFAQARERVLRANPKLADAYKELTPEIGRSA